MGDIISGLSKEEIGNHNEEADDRRKGKKDKGGRFDRGDRKFMKAERNFTKKRRFDDDED